MRIAFLVITASWIIAAVLVAWHIREISGTSGWYVFGGLTFSLGVCAILEGLRKIEKRYSASGSE